jgi:hypothetical protein
VIFFAAATLRYIRSVQDSRGICRASVAWFSFVLAVDTDRCQTCLGTAGVEVLALFLDFFLLSLCSTSPFMLPCLCLLSFHANHRAECRCMAHSCVCTPAAPHPFTSSMIAAPSFDMSNVRRTERAMNNATYMGQDVQSRRAPRSRVSVKAA